MLNQGLINNFLRFQDLVLKYGTIFHVACAPCLKGLLTKKKHALLLKLLSNEKYFPSKKTTMLN